MENLGSVDQNAGRLERRNRDEEAHTENRGSVDQNAGRLEPTGENRNGHTENAGFVDQKAGRLERRNRDEDAHTENLGSVDQNAGRPEPTGVDRNAHTENAGFVDQKARERFEWVRAFLLTEPRQFARQGSVVAGWREYAGRRLGPYFRLAYREKGRQRSIYLGRCAELARRVREVLAGLRRGDRERRRLGRLVAQVRASLRQVKDRLRGQLAELGIQLKGFEFRGQRRALSDPTSANTSLGRSLVPKGWPPRPLAWRCTIGCPEKASLSLWERGGEDGRPTEVKSCRQPEDPHPNPLPKGEGT